MSANAIRQSAARSLTRGLTTIQATTKKIEAEGRRFSFSVYKTAEN
jgi:hypothetical protein